MSRSPPMPTVVCCYAVSLDIDRSTAILRCLAGDLRTQSAIDQLKEKYNTAVALLDARLRTEVDQNKALAAKIRCMSLLLLPWYYMASRAHMGIVFAGAADLVFSVVLSCV
jgi:hypothetical protein